MWIKEEEIKFLEESTGGVLVRDDRLGAFLEGILKRVIREEGKVPGYIVIRDQPFSRYVPVKVLGEVLNMEGITGLDTNLYLFVRTRKVFSVAPGR